MLNGEITKALGAADFQARIAGTGGEFSANTAQQFAASLGPDTEAWVKIIRDTGARVD